MIPYNSKFKTISKQSTENAITLTIKILNEKISKVNLLISFSLLSLSIFSFKELIKYLYVPAKLSNKEHDEFQKNLTKNVFQKEFEQIIERSNAILESYFHKDSLSMVFSNKEKKFTNNSNSYDLSINLMGFKIKLIHPKKVFSFFLNYKFYIFRLLLQF